MTRHECNSTRKTRHGPARQREQGVGSECKLSPNRPLTLAHHCTASLARLDWTSACPDRRESLMETKPVSAAVSDSVAEAVRPAPPSSPERDVLAEVHDAIQADCRVAPDVYLE